MSRQFLAWTRADPSLSEPITAALFPADDGDRAQLVWNRRWGE
jgi:uncharacterized protein (DUF736 family)